MDCPNCAPATLVPALTKQGVELERCARCGGVWLDRGELLLFAKRPKAVAERLARAVEAEAPGNKRSPASGKPMAEIAYSGGGHMTYPMWHCPESGGLWLDGGDLKALTKGEPGLRIDLDRATTAAPLGEAKTEAAAAAGPSPRPGPAAALLPLPNLALRSTATLVGLYALLGAVLIAAVELSGLDPALALVGGIAGVLLQFLVGSFLMDLSLRWLYRMDWVAPKQLPGHLQDFVARVSSEHGIRFPRFGVIDDGAPQAFTYGHSPGNARIVISRGIFELLEPEEAESVVAHEIGHAVHWDMVLMTVVQLVPLILYSIYRTVIRMRSRGKSDSARIAVAITAYLLYIVSQYFVLWFSRTREYHADRFAGTATGNPSTLASALVKIAYGLAAREGAESASGKTATGGASMAGKGGMAAVGAMGVFDAGTATALAVASQAGTADGFDEASLKGAMRWDLWKPWARWYELNSTHPLVANRLLYLSNQAAHAGQAPLVTYDEAQPESYWDEFLADLFVHLLPWAALAAFGLVALGSSLEPALQAQARILMPVMLVVAGAALLLRYGFAYRADFFAEMSIAALLKKVKVSAVRPVPCVLRGRVIGRGVPGYIFSEDFVMRDETGIMFLDYRQPLAIWESLFGLLKAGGYEGSEVVVRGWYRRAPVPYVQLHSIERDGKTRRSWVPLVSRLFAWAVLLYGVAWLAVGLLGPG